MRVGFLGPEGSWSHEACIIMAPGENHVPFDGIPEIFQSVCNGELGRGIIPLENSIEGGVNYSSDMLIEKEAVLIMKELMLPVDHALMSAGDLREIKIVASHGQGIAQCMRSIKAQFPGIEFMETSSTSEAARIASSDRRIAAIASPKAAEKFDLNIIKDHVSDLPMNVTRFVEIGRSISEPTGNDKTSIVYMLPENRPGALWESLSEFATRGINLSRIESRPSKKKPGQYFFFVDIIGHTDEAPVRDAIDSVSRMSSYYRWLGSYPAQSWPTEP